MRHRRRTRDRSIVLLSVWVSTTQAWSPASPAAASHAAVRSAAPAAMMTASGGAALAVSDHRAPQRRTRQLTEALFWTESYYDQAQKRWFGRVQTAQPSETKQPRTICTDLRNPSGLAVDSGTRSVYMADWGDGVISRCSVSGGDVQRLGEGVFGNRQRDGPFGLAIDPNTDTIMWSSAGSAGLRRADLNGENICRASEGDRASWSSKGPYGIALQLRPGCAAARGAREAQAPMQGQGQLATAGLGRVFWTSWGRIQCCELANGEVRDVVRGLVDPTGLALDLNHPGGRLFWTDAKAGKVQCAALDGSNVCDVAKGLSQPWGLALGPTHLFWTDRRRGAIQSCCLRTGQVRDVLTDAVAPEGLALLNVHAPVKLPRAAQAQPGATSQRVTHGSIKLPSTAVQVSARRQLRASLYATKLNSVARAPAATKTPAPPARKPSVQDIISFSDHALSEMELPDLRQDMFNV